MARITLKSGAWIDYRDEFRRSDRHAVKGSFSFTVADDGSRTIPGDFVDSQIDAIATEVITAWGGPGLDGVPVPSLHPLGAAVLDDVLRDPDDSAALDAAMAPLLEAVNRVPNPKASTGS